LINSQENYLIFPDLLGLLNRNTFLAKLLVNFVVDINSPGKITLTELRRMFLQNFEPMFFALARCLWNSFIEISHKS